MAWQEWLHLLSVQIKTHIVNNTLSHIFPPYNILSGLFFKLNLSRQENMPAAAGFVSSIYR